MIHFDKLKSDDFEDIRKLIEATLSGMAEVLEQRGLCPACFCHMVGELAKDMGEMYQDKADAEGDDVKH